MGALRRRVFLLVAVCFACAVGAQEQPAPQAASAPLSREDIENTIRRIGEDSSLDNNAKARVVGTYGQVLDEIQTAEDYNARAAAWIAARQDAPSRTEELKTAIAAPPRVVDMRQFDTASLDTITAALAEAEREQTSAEAELLARREEADARVNRRQELADLTAAARTQIDQARAAPAAAQGAGAEDAEANRLYAFARVQSLEAEIALYEAELGSFEVRGPVRTLEEDLAQRKLAEATANVVALSRLVALNREEEAEIAAARAGEEVAQAQRAPESIRADALALAEQNRALAEHRTGPESPSAKAEEARLRKAEIKAEYNRIYSSWKGVYQRVTAAGLTNSVGQLLRLNRAQLPSRREHLTNIKLREELIGTVQLEQIELQEMRSEDVDAAIDKIIDEAAAEAAEEVSLREFLRPLLVTRRETLGALIQEYEEYLGELDDLNKEERKLVEQRDTFSQYIDQHVLWVSSGNILSADDLRDSADAVRWLVGWRNWRDVADAAVEDIQRNLLLESLALLIFAGAALARRWQFRRILALADLAEKRIATNYRWTLETLLHTVILGAYVPLVLVYIGWRLDTVLAMSDFKGLLADALVVIAAFLASLEIPRQIFRPRGLGEVHFGWEPEATASSRRALSWAIPAALPLLLLIAMIEYQELGEWRESAGRLAFVVLTIVWAALGHRLTNRKAPSVMVYFPLSIPGERSRIQRFLYFLAAGAPLCLALAACLGYFDTALRIAIRIHVTLIFSFAISICIGLVMRALLVTRRRLAIEQARKKRAELREAQKKAGDGADLSAAPESQAPEFDLVAIDTQTTRLTRSAAVIALAVGMWFIWIDFVPALRVLDEITIGDTTAPVRGFIPGAAGQPGAAGPVEAAAGETPGGAAENTIPSPDDVVKGVEELTYADLLLAIVIVVLTVSSSRNLPGLLEIAVLQRLSLSSGERYAIKAVLGYLFVLIGAWLTLYTLGIEWKKFQWLVAGLGLGIGFGLQEIFANFVSGLIILFEQPVRVGDTVTVGDINGTVTRIRIRATTILDGELKELIVPNKEFVTGKLVNWSLSDTTLRTTIPVCVAYGSDTRLVRETLGRVAYANPRVLKDPPPQVALTKFGDNGLVFETRVYVANNEQLSACRDELHDAINEAFREAKIEMPLPQQDVHIRTAPAGGAGPPDLH